MGQLVNYHPSHMQNSDFQMGRDTDGFLLNTHEAHVDLAFVGHFTLAANGSIRMANLAGSAMVRIERSRLLGRAFGLLVPAERRPEVDAFLARVFAGHLEQSMDSELLCKGQARRSVYIGARRSLNGDECSTVVVDITERKRAENELRTSEIRYRRLFEAARDGVLLLDPGTGKITDANPFMTELLGYPRDRLIGKELYEIGLFKDEIASRNMFKMLKTGREVRYEDLPLERQDGRHQEVEVVANLYQENGRAVIQCNVRDITERKRTEGALATDASACVTMLNAVAERLTGWTQEQAFGRPVNEVFHIKRGTRHADHAGLRCIGVQSLAWHRGHLRANLHPQRRQPLSGSGFGHGSARRPKHHYRLSVNRYRQYGPQTSRSRTPALA